MAEYITQSAFARICGVSRQALAKAVKQGRVIRASSGIDPQNPSNQYYKTQAAKNKTLTSAPKTKTKVQAKKVQVKVNQPPEEPPAVAASQPPPKAGDGQESTFDLFQKAYEETRLKKIQADLAVLKYAEQVGAVVDIESLRQKMGAFASFLFTHLVYLPENIAADLWMSARSDEDPERKIREMLSERIKNVIKEAEAAAAEVLPPDRGVRYVMLEPEEDE